MIEVYESLFRVVIFLTCLIIALTRTIRYQSRGWAVLSFVYLSFLLGDLFWAFYFLFYQSFSYMAYLGWYVGYMLIFILLKQKDETQSDPNAPVARSVLVWIIPVLSLLSYIYFFRYGDYIDNIVSESLSAITGYLAVAMLLRGTKKKMLCWCAIAIVVMEHIIWFAGEFWPEETVASPYYWLDASQAFLLALLIPAYRKAVRA